MGARSPRPECFFGVFTITPASTFTVLALCITVTGMPHPQWVYGAHCPSRTEQERDAGDGRRGADTPPRQVYILTLSGLVAATGQKGYSAG